MKCVPSTQALCLLLCLLLETVTATAKVSDCSRKNMAMVKSHIGHPSYFCNWYLSHARKNSPLPGLKVAELEQTCMCLGAVKNRHPAKPSAAAIQTHQEKCVASDLTIVKEAFPFTKAFCNFFNKWSYQAGTEPIQGMANQRTYNACKCILKKDEPQPQSTSTSTSTSTPAPFCSSAPVTSLASDPYATTFCQSVLGIHTATQTVEQTFYQSICGPAPTQGGHQKREPLPRTLTTPTYLTSESGAYVTSACECVPNVPTPSAAVTEVNTLSVGIYDNPEMTTTVASREVVAPEPTDPPTPSVGTRVVLNQTATYDALPQYTLNATLADTAMQRIYCTGNPVKTQMQSGDMIRYTCEDMDSCMLWCTVYNDSGDEDACRAVLFMPNPDTLMPMCYMYGAVPLSDEEHCAYFGGNSSYGVGMLVQDY
ncbi:hypothetical protein ANO11243_004260 [Dothideomycetidae sp. 11243]|nr:hypothetical protein ANO11243_004260 [fungal sp. No.11243]